MADWLGFILFASLGVCCAVAPHRVIGFYKKIDRSGRFVAPKPSGIRIAGLLWLALVVVVFVFFFETRFLIGHFKFASATPTCVPLRAKGSA